MEKRDLKMNIEGVSLRKLFVGMAIAIVAGSVAVSQPAMAEKRTVSAGTVIPVKLDKSLSSKSAQEGDGFTATVTRVGDYDATTLPVGTKIEGVIKAARAKEDKKPGMLDLAFRRVTLPNGHSYSISGSPIDLNNKSVTTRDGRIVAKSGNKGPNRLTYVGIGAGAGLLVNVLGHRKGTLTDVLIGAAGGYGAGALIKNGKEAKDVYLKAGTTMGVSLDRSFAYAR
jgi:hypothetical protein